MEDEKILKESNNLVEQICSKFGYSSQDTEKNESLKTVLKKVIPAMLVGSSQEDRELFYQMLSHTPIVITENLTQENYDRLVEQYIGKDVNQHIIDEDIDLGEYGKDLGNGAYVSEPILDENMNLQGKKSFIYIQKVTERAKEFYGTDINVSHLIHELGHAWHAEKDQFTMLEDKTLRERIGTAEFTYSFSKTTDNKFVKKCNKTTGIMLEESMNTLEEEIAMANYMGISLEEMREKYNSTLVPSRYQGYMSGFAEYMLNKLGKDNFESYRLYGKTEAINKITNLMEKTDYWANRETDILPSSDSPRSYDKKRAVFEKTNKKSIQDFVAEYESVYFPDISKMTPLEKLDNVLEQKYNLSMVRYNMGPELYKDFLERLGYEGYSLINQTATLMNEKNQESSLKVDKPKTIMPKNALKNALSQGITTEQTNKANSIEQSLLDLEHNSDEETIAKQ